MGTYSDALGVDEALEDLAQWVTWADQAHTAGNDTDAEYNLNQFWSAKDALDADTTAANIEDVVYLDALSHRVSGYVYMRQMTDATPEQMAAIADNMKEQFSLSSSEFSQAGYPLQASHDALRAQQADSDAQQTKAGYIDASLVTAVKDRYHTVLQSAGSVIASAGTVASMLGNPLVLAGLGILAVMFFLGSRK